MEDQQKHFFNLECTGTKSAKNLQHVLMGPNNKGISYTIENNTIGYNMLQWKDIDNAKEIFGLSESILEEKTAKKKNKMICEEINLPEQVENYVVCGRNARKWYQFSS